jgi:hypothetical protein
MAGKEGYSSFPDQNAGIFRATPEQIDQLRQSRELLEKLRDHGLQKKGYDLAPPFGGKRVSIKMGR